MKKLLVPKKVKILGHTYSVRFEPKLEDRFGYIGTCDLNGGTITIDPASIDSVRVTTLFHEVVHILSWCGHLELTEQQVQVLAEGLRQVLQEQGYKFDWKGIK